ncbi:MAG: response regulator [Proteobacteria bacterium]|nr:response regulator [Pseudomonadota bacterium]MBU1709356.1 response regulator [Pseudomonadota bacterium]
MNENVRILCVDDEKNVLKALNRLFMDEEYEVLLANSGEEGLETLAVEESVQVIISDYRMPGMNGVDFLKQVFERWPDTVRIVLSGYADTAAVVAAINEGQIYKFIPKPWNDDELKVTIAKAVEVYFLRKRNIELTRELSDHNEELKRLNENLEELVEERTGELLFQNKVLERGQKILDALPVGVLGLDTQGMIVQCNARAHYFFQGEGAVVPGMDATEILPPAFLELIDTISDTMVSRTIQVAGRELVVKGAGLVVDDSREGVVLVLDEK